ncbi:MAG: hypothetical protein QM703_24230 [Gemmatales bacterium]
MTFNILVEPENGVFKAQVLGNPYLQAEGTNKEEATDALLDLIRQRMKHGNLFGDRNVVQITIPADTLELWN